MAHWRVPMAPRAGTSAPCSGGTEATAIDSLWTSIPMKSVLDCDMVALRVLGVLVCPQVALVWYAHPRHVGGQPPAIGSHYVSASSDKECAVPMGPRSMRAFDMDLYRLHTGAPWPRCVLSMAIRWLS